MKEINLSSDSFSADSHFVEIHGCHSCEVAAEGESTGKSGHTYKYDFICATTPWRPIGGGIERYEYFWILCHDSEPSWHGPFADFKYAEGFIHGYYEMKPRIRFFYRGTYTKK